MGDPSMGLQARLMSQALRKLTAIVSKSKTCLIFINQIREKLASCSAIRKPPPVAARSSFYASMRVDIRRIQAIKDGDRVVGSRTAPKIVKNKVAAPFAKPNSTFSTRRHLPRRRPDDLGVDKGVLEKSGTWISYGGERMGRDAKTPASS